MGSWYKTSINYYENIMRLFDEILVGSWYKTSINYYENILYKSKEGFKQVEKGKI